MGCVASRLEEEEEVVSICRERKKQLKLAVERRYALADAHGRYCQALYGVSAAIRLFVACHSSPPSPFLITFPPPCPPSPLKENVVSNPLFLQQTPSEPTKAAIGCESCASSTSSESSEPEREERAERQEEEQEQVCGYFYMQMPPSMPSPQRDFGWDFFNPFDILRPEIISGYSRNSDDDLRVVREEEGIPELEEEGDRMEEEKKVAAAEETENVENQQNGVEVIREADAPSQGEQKSLTVIDTPEKGRELLEAMKDIEDHFIRAYDSGKDVSRMLEVNRFHLQSGLEEIKENSTKLIQAITWRSTSSRTSSCKSLAASSSKGSSTWTEFNNDLFDDYGGMDSGSHSLTLGRLYAWEKKLYEEVKAGDNTRKIYERKCNQLRNQDVRGDDRLVVDRTRVAVKDLYSRILVAIRSAESISKQIEKLRDEELQPQIIELLQGLTRTWKVMWESHEIQNKIMFKVKSYTCPTYGKFCNNTHRLATQQLEAEIHNWRTRFIEYIAAQKAYIEALYGWLSKFVIPEVEFYSRSRNSSLPCRVSGPPLLVICHGWLASMDKLPDKAVGISMEGFGKDIRALWVQQGGEQHQKRKVDGMAKELDRKILAYQKSENRIFESKLSEHNSDPGSRAEFLNEKKDSLDAFRRRVDGEKEKHIDCMQETQRITLNGFQTGFCGVFDSLTEFSKASLKMYNDLLKQSVSAQKKGNPGYIEGPQNGEDAST
ncbi:protein ALTERED PHOSPHATE STARVATION RESPONSE 1-like [Diospyros lotus]|uniref:protein ALTERED PHOSPHATE STARVATION RESPONSE 1-like n=1 Tax=Diospyros lotus TaxID=55363 RepID=UPI00224EF78F|nr:protein ALTERED PHOSPHATE STARVATION RESPONSE 1-like [Diospyros lotus]